jgi:lysophospholipase L1-like esterase
MALRTRRTLPIGVVAAWVALTAVVGGQALYAKRRRDLPSVVGGDASGEEGDPALPSVLVACAGDSTLTGPGLDHPEQTWIRLALRTVATERHLTLKSFAVGGSCVADVLDEQLDGLLATRPDVAVIAVGSNDVLKWTPLRELEISFGLLATVLSEHVPRVVIGGVGDLGTLARVSPPLSNVVTVRARQVDRVIRRTCERFPNVAYVDVSSTDSAFRSGGRHVFTADRFHPNHYGHEMWAAAAAPVLANAIRDVTPR